MHAHHILLTQHCDKMADNDVSFCQHTVTEFITKEDIRPQALSNSSTPAVRQHGHHHTLLQSLTKNCQHGMQQAKNCCSTWNWTQWHADDTNFWTPVSLLGSCFPHVNRYRIQKAHIYVAVQLLERLLWMMVSHQTS